MLRRPGIEGSQENVPPAIFFTWTYILYIVIARTIFICLCNLLNINNMLTLPTARVPTSSRLCTLHSAVGETVSLWGRTGTTSLSRLHGLRGRRALVCASAVGEQLSTAASWPITLRIHHFVPIPVDVPSSAVGVRGLQLDDYMRCATHTHILYIICRVFCFQRVGAVKYKRYI